MVKGDSLLSTTNNFIADNKTSFEDLLAELKLTLNTSNKLLSEVDGLIVQTKNKENNLGKILYDETIINELKSTLSQTQKLLKIFVEQLEGEGLNVDANIF